MITSGLLGFMGLFHETGDRQVQLYDQDGWQNEPVTELHPANVPDLGDVVTGGIS